MESGKVNIEVSCHDYLQFELCNPIYFAGIQASRQMYNDSLQSFLKKQKSFKGTG